VTVGGGRAGGRSGATPGGPVYDRRREMPAPPADPVPAAPSVPLRPRVGRLVSPHPVPVPPTSRLRGLTGAGGVES
jgi:hypothetical protein